MQAEKHLVAVFYIPRSEELTPTELLRRADVIFAAGRRVPVLDELVSGTWASLDCVARAVDLGPYRVLEIYFWQNDFIEMRMRNKEAESLEDEPALPLALAFRHACEELLPDVALLYTSLFQAEQDYLDLTGKEVLSGRIRDLFQQGPGLLYLNEANLRHMEPSWWLCERDTLPVSSGLLVFSS